ncbi:MAG: AAA family ATPase [Chloroflexi bacterium]|nr:AAA family ATPase [Chloroflexota bacterium]
MLIERLQVKGLLSFGPDGIDLPLEPLNVIIGPNGSGKSNLLQVLGLLRTAAGGDIALFNGRDWGKLLWHGPPHISDDAPAKATVVARVKLSKWERSKTYSLELFLSYGESKRESIIMEDRNELAILHRHYNDVRLYSTWAFGPLAPIREGQGPPAQPFWPSDTESPSSMPSFGQDSGVRYKRDLYNPIASGPYEYEDDKWLTETAGNLPGVISRFPVERRNTLAKYLNRLYDGVVGIATPFINGKVSVEIEESGGRRIPAERLSDGTLRYLSLLTILLDPDPPPLIGIEEPELGLHPDIVFELAKLLVEASERTQLVVTTHSHTLVDALTDHPTSVVACGKHEGQTWFKRVTPGVAEVWLNDNSLGQVWSMGGIGGNRW